jgi:hypothetical protein
LTAYIDDCGLVIDDWRAANPELGASRTLGLPRCEPLDWRAANLETGALRALNHQSEIINQQFPVE